MKLNGSLIVTLPDFRRLFDFNQFWVGRHHFVRDMNPSKVYYWNTDDIDSYNKICEWIKSEDEGDCAESLRTNGLEALSKYSRQEIGKKAFSSVHFIEDYTDDIIVVPAGGCLNLPGHLASQDENVSEHERLHKVELGSGDVAATIMIGGEKVKELECGKCVYVTEINGKFLRALPTSLSSGPTSLQIINIGGKFESVLKIDKYIMGRRFQDEVKDVTQMCFINGRAFYNADKFLTIYKSRTL